MVTGPNSNPIPERLMQFVFGFAPPVLIKAAIRHRIFDILDEAAMDFERLCAETNVFRRRLRSLVNSLVSLELLVDPSRRKRRQH